MGNGMISIKPFSERDFNMCERAALVCRLLIGCVFGYVCGRVHVFFVLCDSRIRFFATIIVVFHAGWPIGSPAMNSTHFSFSVSTACRSLLGAWGSGEQAQRQLLAYSVKIEASVSSVSVEWYLMRPNSMAATQLMIRIARMRKRYHTKIEGFLVPVFW